MAEILVHDGEIEVQLSAFEKVGAVHGEVRAPLSSVVGAHVVDDAWHELRGIRAPGTGVPGEIMLGTCRGSFGKDFAAVYRHKPAVVVELEGQEFQRLIVTTADPEATVRELGFCV